MSLPKRDRAHIDRRKLAEYLLNRNHPDATGKSSFFCSRYGSDLQRLRDDQFEHAEGSVVDVEETRLGKRCVIEEPLSGALDRSVWMIRTGESFPRLVTVYPTE